VWCGVPRERNDVRYYHPAPARYGMGGQALCSQPVQPLPRQHHAPWSVRRPGRLAQSLPLLGCHGWLCLHVPHCVSSGDQQAGIQARLPDMGVGRELRLCGHLHRSHRSLESYQAQAWAVEWRAQGACWGRKGRKRAAGRSGEVRQLIVGREKEEW
jgi:hypothetical protein